jgi:hypothetical protein
LRSVKTSTVTKGICIGVLYMVRKKLALGHRSEGGSRVR